MCKITSGLKKIIMIIATLVFAFIFLSIVVLDRRTDLWFYYNLPVSNIFILIATIVCMALVYWKKDRLSKMSSYWDSKKYDIKPVLILLVLQLIIVYNIFLYVGWDIQYLYEAARQYLGGGLSDFSQSYFATNPNNVWMLFINIIFQKIGSVVGVNGYIIMSFLGIILVDISIYLTAKCVFLMTNRNLYSWITFFISSILVGLSPWIMVPYSDVYSLCLPILTVYLYLKWHGSKEKRLLKNIIIVVPAVLGMAIKPTNIIVLIAILIEIILNGFSKNNYTATMKKAGMMIISIILVFICFVGMKQGIYSFLNYEPNEYRAKTMMHYMLIGSNYDYAGNYNWDDNDYTDSFPTAAEKNKADWRLIKERYAGMGIKKFVYHFARKTDLNFNMGIMGWGKEPDFVNFYIEKDGIVSRALRSIYYPGGSYVDGREFATGGHYFVLFALVEQIVWLFILLNCFGVVLINTYKMLVKKEDVRVSELILILSVIGITLFVSIFETNARYLFSYTSIFIVLAVAGVKKLYEKE